MNDARRKEIEKALGLISEAKSILETARDEEQEYFDNMPENMQSGEKGEKASEAAGALEEAVNSIEEIESNLETAKE